MSRVSPRVALAGALALFGACGADDDTTVAPTSVAGADEPAPVVVDTDAGLDDAVALMYLASSPEVDLRAVTVSGTGLAHCFPGARNVVGLLELAGRPDVPVSCGAEEPLGGDGGAFPDDWRRFTDSRYGDAWRIGQGPVDERPAAQLLVDTTSPRSDGGDDRPVTLVTLGPLTNVAAALALDQDFGRGVERIVAMGGAFDVPGNLEAVQPPPAANVAEWNIYADPEAARSVVRSGLPITFVPLDATNSVPLDMYVLRAVARAPESAALGVTQRLLAGIRGMIAENAYYLWDPLAAVLAMHPELGDVEQRSIDVVVDGPEAGRTIDAASGATVDVFTVADGRAAEATLIGTLAGGSAVPISGRPDLVIDPVACSATGAPVGPGAQVIELASDVGDDVPRTVVVGILDAGRGQADIEAFLAAPTDQGPEWFEQVTGLVSGEGGLPADLVELDAGSYDVVCLEGEWPAIEFAGLTRVDVG